MKAPFDVHGPVEVGPYLAGEKQRLVVEPGDAFSSVVNFTVVLHAQQREVSYLPDVVEHLAATGACDAMVDLGACEPASSSFGREVFAATVGSFHHDEPLTSRGVQPEVVKRFLCWDVS